MIRTEMSEKCQKNDPVPKKTRLLESETFDLCRTEL